MPYLISKFQNETYHGHNLQYFQLKNSIVVKEPHFSKLVSVIRFECLTMKSKIAWQSLVCQTIDRSTIFNNEKCVGRVYSERECAFGVFACPT